MDFFRLRLNLAGFLILALFCICGQGICAEEKKEFIQIFFCSGDKISGEYLAEKDDQIIIMSQECLSPVTVKKSSIKKMIKTSAPRVFKETPQAAESKEAKASGALKTAQNREQDITGLEKEIVAAKEEKRRKWEKKISLGYTKATGNTQNSMLSGRLFFDSKTEENQITFKGDFYYSSANNKMDGQKWDALGRYSFNFGAQNRYYNYYKIEGDHDRFANIEYRGVGTTGIGYTFSDTPDFKFLTELGVGLEYTQFGDDTKRRYETVLTPRVYFEKKIFCNARILSDISLYPAIKDWDYRLHAETALVSPLNDEFSLRVSYIHDYLSNPDKSAKKSDVMFVSALEYSF